MKKLVSVILTGALIICTAAAVYAESSINYIDLKSTNWAYEAVNTMSQKGIVKGYNDGSFKPGNVVTYGEFIKMALVAATGEDVGNSSKGNWATNYYNKALELKYFGSTDIKAGQLNNQIPRSDMALIISNILGKVEIKDYEALELQLKDINSNTKNDYDIVKVYAKGVITGYEDSTFRPENTLTRAESATVIYRLVDESKRVLPRSSNNNGKLMLKDFMDTSTLSIMRDGEYASEDYVIKTADEMGITMIKDNGKDGFSFWLVPGQDNKGIVAIENGKAVVDCRRAPYFEPEDNECHGKYMISCKNYSKSSIDYFLRTSYESKDTTIVVKNPFK